MQGQHRIKAAGHSLRPTLAFAYGGCWFLDLLAQKNPSKGQGLVTVMKERIFTQKGSSKDKVQRLITDLDE
jgi:hypothetical protein